MMKGGLGGMMKQAQQMQQNMQKAQAELATRGSRGPGRFRHGQGHHDLRSCRAPGVARRQRADG